MAMSILQLASVAETLQEALDEQRGSPSKWSDEALFGENLAVEQYQFLGFLEGETEKNDQVPSLNDEARTAGRYLFLGLQ